jgi:hypothetical protein
MKPKNPVGKLTRVVKEVPKNTEKTMRENFWKQDSTDFANMLASPAAKAMKRQINSGSESSLDSAKSTFSEMNRKYDKLKKMYPDKKIM